jgi:hypothetical protein
MSSMASGRHGLCSTVVLNADFKCAGQLERAELIL